MATANIGLQFTADKGLPTLQQVLQALKDIKTASKEKIDIKVSTNVEKTGQSLTTVAKGLKKLKEANLQEKDIQKIERLNNIFKAENSNKMTQFGQSLGEVAKGLSKLANADSEKLARNLDMIKSNLNAISKINLSNLDSLKNIQNVTSGVKSLASQPTQKNTTQTVDNFRFPYQDLVMGGIGIRLMQGFFKETLGLEKAIYDLGVVSDASNSQINDLYGTFLKMSQTLPIGAQRLTENITEISRIGFSLEQSLAIGTAGAKFAIASGDKIEGVTDSLGKVILALDLLDVSEQEVTRITDEMQSVLLKTPLSTQTLSEGMRHAASAMAVYTQNSTRIGEDLEKYKKNVLTTTLALEGAFSRIGRTGSKDLLPLSVMAS